ncbi:MAG: motility protein A, partial [Mobilitalea sp.]
MDLATILGLVICFGVVVYGILVGQSGIEILMNFVDAPSVFITIGGSMACMLTMSASLKGFLENVKSFTLALKVLPANEEVTIKSIIELSNVARKEGLLALEEAANGIDDEFLKKGV